MKQLKSELIVDDDIDITIITLKLGSYKLDELRIEKDKQYVKKSDYLVIQRERIEMNIEEADLVYRLEPFHEPRRIVNSDNEFLQKVTYEYITLFKGTYPQCVKYAKDCLMEKYS